MGWLPWGNFKRRMLASHAEAIALGVVESRVRGDASLWDRTRGSHGSFVGRLGAAGRGRAAPRRSRVLGIGGGEQGNEGSLCVKIYDRSGNLGKVRRGADFPRVGGLPFVETSSTVRAPV